MRKLNSHEGGKSLIGFKNLQLRIECYDRVSQSVDGQTELLILNLQLSTFLFLRFVDFGEIFGIGQELLVIFLRFRHVTF